MAILLQHHPCDADTRCVVVQWIRKGKLGTVVAFGEMVYRALDA